MRHQNSLYMWNIFDGPQDYPGSVVVRRCTVARGHVVADRDPWSICPDLAAARATIPGAACVRAPRSPDDVPSLVETWF